MATANDHSDHQHQPDANGEEQHNGQQEGQHSPERGGGGGGGAASGEGGGGGGTISTASSRSSTSSVKSVYLYRNGDKFAPPKKIVLNPRQLRDWDVFLEQATQSVNPIRGAVRQIVTPRRGRRRVLEFESLEDKGHYVALSKGEKFKPMPYVPEDDAVAAGHTDGAGVTESPGVTPRGRNISNNRVVLEPIRPVVHNRKLMTIQPRFNSQMDVISHQSKTIRIYRNGDEFTPAIIILLKPNEQSSMDTVLRAVEERVVLPSNRAIRKLYDMSGRRVKEPKDIENEKYYVAASREPFTGRPYGQKLPVLIVGRADRRSTIKYLAQPITPAKDSSRRPKAESQQKPAKRPTKAEKQKAASQIQASIKGFHARKAAAEKLSAEPIAIRQDPNNSKANHPPKQQQTQQQQQQPPQQQQTQQQPRQQPQQQQQAQQQKQQQQKQPAQAQQKQQTEKKPQPTQEEQEKAATTIQSSVRGFETRKAVAEKVANKPIDIKQDQSNSKGNQQKQQPQKEQKQQQQQPQKQQSQQQQQQQQAQRQQTQEEQKKPQPTREEQEKAATTIQSSVRGFETRKAVAEKVANKPIDIKQDQSNSKENQQKQEQQKEQKQQQQQQQPQEKKVEQKSQPSPQELDKAATTIQAAYKGHAARQAAAADIAQKEKQQQQQKTEEQPKKELTPAEANAASNIAAAVNSYKTRKDAAKGEAVRTADASSEEQKKQQN